VRTERGVEPLVACYQKRVVAILRKEIEAGHLRAADLASILRMAELGPDDLAPFGSADELLANVNTPADYARVQYRPR
jgi:molybdopterin-guanine dinucleotide biosynthesis protein A